MLDAVPHFARAPPPTVAQKKMLTSTFLPTGPCDPPEKVPYPTVAQEDGVEDELVVLDAVPLLARVPPPTVAQKKMLAFHSQMGSRYCTSSQD